MAPKSIKIDENGFPNLICFGIVFCIDVDRFLVATSSPRTQQIIEIPLVQIKYIYLIIHVFV